MDRNLFDDVPTDIAEERVSNLLVTPNLKIERIVSTGQASPAEFWYDQPWGEWVVVLAGSAGLKIEGESEIRVMRKGDHIQIPAHRRHRIEWTDSGRPTIWLAVHYR
ncbi:MAG: cupin domain-containing protein [Hyphomicrobiales bacterium]